MKTNDVSITSLWTDLCGQTSDYLHYGLICWSYFLDYLSNSLKSVHQTSSDADGKSSNFFLCYQQFKSREANPLFNLITLGVRAQKMTDTIITDRHVNSLCMSNMFVSLDVTGSVCRAVVFLMSGVVLSVTLNFDSSCTSGVVNSWRSAPQMCQFGVSTQQPPPHPPFFPLAKSYIEGGISWFSKTKSSCVCVGGGGLQRSSQSGAPTVATSAHSSRKQQHQWIHFILQRAQQEHAALSTLPTTSLA